MFGFTLAGAVEVVFEHALGVDTQEQRRLTDGGHVGGVLVGPHAVAGEVVYLSEHLGGFLELAVAAADLVAEQAQLHAPGKSVEVGRDD